MRDPQLLWPELPSLLDNVTDVDRIEVKAILAPGRDEPEALGIDPVDAQVRQVYYLDTPDLHLYRRGVVLRVRRWRRGADVVIKLRADAPCSVVDGPNGASDLVVEVDVLPGSYLRSTALKQAVDPVRVRSVVAGVCPPLTLLSPDQRAILEAVAGDVAPDELTVLGPVTVVKLPAPQLCLGGKTTVEVWHYPDGSRIVEVSAKCSPSQAVHDAAEVTRALAEGHVTLSAEQATKTHRTLQYFAAGVRNRERSS